MGEEHRTAKCGHAPCGPQVTVHQKSNGRCGYRGVYTCCSIWACPECASKISARRSTEVGELIKAHSKAGQSSYMATLTMRHGLGDNCEHLRKTVAWAWDQLLRSGAMRRLRDQYNIIGYIRSMEVTHGQNGWHPHIHVLFMARNFSSAELTAVADSIFDRWKKVLKRKGYEACRLGFDFQRAKNADVAAQYVAKWGAGTEIAKGSEKLGKAGRSPWQLLDDCGHGDKWAGNLFVEYVKAFHGARHLTYARGIRELYGLRGPVADEQLELDDDLPEYDEGGEVYRFQHGLWWRLVREKLTIQVLEAGEAGGTKAIDQLLDRHGIAPSQNKPPPHNVYRTPKTARGVKVLNNGGIKLEMRHIANEYRRSK
ncbi:MAG: hypothetical protein COA52_09705 [Hyphomicrobiales bacterium]|nr:MAG: hypothetical protein COA52_09705 [Hyphomicrobiales bacterium]